MPPTRKLKKGEREIATVYFLKILGRYMMESHSLLTSVGSIVYEGIQSYTRLLLGLNFMSFTNISGIIFWSSVVCRRRLAVIRRRSSSGSSLSVVSCPSFPSSSVVIRCRLRSSMMPWAVHFDVFLGGGLASWDNRRSYGQLL